MNRRHRLNYIYFGTLFVLIALLHIFHVQLIEQGTGLNRAFYIVHVIGQCLFEVSLLAFACAWAVEKFPSFIKTIFIMATFLLVVIHLIDFPLMRIMDMSVWYGFTFVFADSFENFVELLKASNIPLLTWVMLGAGAAILALVGLLLFHLADQFSKKKPFLFSYRAATFFALSVISLLTLFDYQASSVASAQSDGKFLKALPWKTTLFTEAYPQWDLNASLAQKPLEEWHQKQLESMAAHPKAKPNIYLFISESMREDFITPETAPTLSKFRREELSFPCAVSGANDTHLSWLSIFHSVYPFSWEERQPKKWSKGSLPLQMFKKAGYKIHVFSASQLNFYQMDKVLFGVDRSLVDDFRIFSEEEAAENHVYDAKCVDTLIEKMQTAFDGNLFIIFFEGTHFDYSWPSHVTLPARPAIKAIDFIRLTYSQEDVEGIKNRYRHAIYHVDQQFNRFLAALNTHPKQDEAVVVFTSDHGEEFFEEGRIFHASNLNRAQTQVPLYYRLPAQKSDHAITSHFDIFPTLLDYVFGTVPPWFDGESVLQPKQKPFAMTARFNGNRIPYEFLITTPEELLVARFDKRYNVNLSRTLEIVSRKNKEETPIQGSMSELQDRYQTIIESLLSSRTERQ